MLVVAADESVMPQTREHFQICRLLQIPAGVIVLTKADLADADTIELATLEVRELTAGSALADVPILVVSSKTGQGLDGLRRALVEAAVSMRARNREGQMRLPIDRVVSVKGFETVVTGTPWRARFETMTSYWCCRARPVKVRGLCSRTPRSNADPGIVSP
jgi:selenocysteine-specific elongation factor